jgi:hypothetical protein
MKPPKLTIEEHRGIGAELKRIREYLLDLCCKIPDKYGKTNRAGKQAVRVYEGICHLRNVMENQMYLDCPGNGDTGIYYGESPIPVSLQDAPTHILEAATTIQNWMVQNGHRDWQLGGICDRSHAYKLGVCNEHYERLTAENAKLRVAFLAAHAFIESHVADPDITENMATKYAAYQAASKGLNS